MVEYCVVFKKRQASVTPTVWCRREIYFALWLFIVWCFRRAKQAWRLRFDVGVKFISRDGWVLRDVQYALSKHDAYGVVGVKFISRDGCVLCDVQDAPSKRDAYVWCRREIHFARWVSIVWCLRRAKQAWRLRFDVGVKFISRDVFVLWGSNTFGVNWLGVFLSSKIRFYLQDW